MEIPTATKTGTRFLASLCRVCRLRVNVSHGIGFQLHMTSQYWETTLRWIYRQFSKIRCILVHSRQLNCGPIRCSWSIACRRCSKNIFILDITIGFNGLGKDNCKTRRESFKFWYLVRLISEILRYISLHLTQIQRGEGKSDGCLIHRTLKQNHMAVAYFSWYFTRRPAWKPRPRRGSGFHAGSPSEVSWKICNNKCGFVFIPRLYP